MQGNRASKCCFVFVSCYLAEHVNVSYIRGLSAPLNKESYLHMAAILSQLGTVPRSAVCAHPGM